MRTPEPKFVVLRAAFADHVVVSVEIREIVSVADLRAAEGLQQTVWGVRELDVVPSHQLVAAREAGGVLIGAFDDSTLVGFAYGFPGVTRYGPSIHSHLTAVLPGYRGYQVGTRLKWAQREHALSKGIAYMTWTFDPLRTLNAHLNFCKLGVLSDRYVVDFYPEEENNVLNRAGTDRLWVTWRLDAPRVADRLEGRFPVPRDVHQMNGSALVSVGVDGEPVVVQRPLSDNHPQTIHVPPALEEASMDLTIHWRRATRDAFARLLNHGYRVEEFYKPCDARPYGTYFLNKNGLHAGLF